MKALILSILSAAFLMWFNITGQAQTEEERIHQLEIRRAVEAQQKLDRSLDSAVLLMDAEQYIAADAVFRYVLENIRSVPSDLAFYFGKNSFHTGKFKQSVDWLNKYIQLKGTTGQFSKEAVDWLRRSEAALLQENERQATQTAQIFSSDITVDCGPSGKVTCPVCNGTSVIIKSNYLGNTYSSCPFCHHTGILSCEEYNLLLQGELHMDTD